MKTTIKAAITSLSLSGSLYLQAQSPACPSVTTGPNQSICSGCTNITATVQGTVATTSYSVASVPYSPFPFSQGTQILIGIDDIWSGVISLPFCFEFYGQTYTQCVIGSNGVISFDLANANQYNTWPISTPMPSNADPDMLNCIMGPWHDIDPSVGGNVYWQLGGTAPCRYLVVSWNQIPMFSCNNLINTQQTVLYETTNIIDVFIQNKPVCSSWNAGAAIEGLNNPTGTAGVIVPGRNFPTQWTATNDGQRFTPTGAPQFTFQWLDGNNNVVGNTTTLNVCPTSTTTYTAQVTNQSCAGPITVTATTTVTVGGLALQTNSTPTSCSGNTGTATVTATGPGPFTYLWNPSGQTSPTATGLGAGVYTVTVTDPNGCTGTSTVTITSPANLGVSVASTTDNQCYGQTNGSATITVTGGTAPLTYSWSPSGGSTTTATGLAGGTYTFTVTDANGCSMTQTVTINTPPQLNFSVSVQQPTFGQSNGSATVAASGGTPPYTYAWQPSGGTDASATGLAEGSYTVTVTDVNGCTDTIQFVLDSDFDFSFYAPNTVTPNGDGHNDLFLPVGVWWDVSKYELYVFDRWGNRLFATTDPTQGWDGKVQKGSGKIVQEDTYVWKAIVYDMRGKKHQYVGHVNVVR